MPFNRVYLLTIVIEINMNNPEIIYYSILWWGRHFYSTHFYFMENVTKWQSTPTKTAHKFCKHTANSSVFGDVKILCVLYHFSLRLSFSLHFLASFCAFVCNKLCYAKRRFMCDCHWHYHLKFQIDCLMNDGKCLHARNILYLYMYMKS